MVEVIPFSDNFLESALNLFVNSYKAEQVRSPLLPDIVAKEPEWILN
ncbi:MAG TPA: hypothetical protein G4O15_12835 [Dehalococcoidia bacterium]|nr:hypothetical protein [Dehalococcoidia bacterium]